MFSGEEGLCVQVGHGYRMHPNSIEVSLRHPRSDMQIFIRSEKNVRMFRGGVDLSAAGGTLCGAARGCLCAGCQVLGSLMFYSNGQYYSRHIMSSIWNFIPLNLLL